MTAARTPGDHVTIAKMQQQREPLWRSVDEVAPACYALLEKLHAVQEVSASVGDDASAECKHLELEHDQYAAGRALSLLSRWVAQVAGEPFLPVLCWSRSETHDARPRLEYVLRRGKNWGWRMPCTVLTWLGVVVEALRAGWYASEQPPDQARHLARFSKTAQFPEEAELVRFLAYVAFPGRSHEIICECVAEGERVGLWLRRERVAEFDAFFHFGLC